MNQRLDAALDVVPELAPHADRLRAPSTPSPASPDVRVQRIHGDLHLGQTLRTVKGWKIVDFEGEPAKPLAERVAAGLALARRGRHAALLRLRPAGRGAHLGRATDDDATRAAGLPRRRVGRAQPRGVPRRPTPGRELTADEQTLLAAYVADKAVYEAVYEARNRPTWVAIPLEAVARIGVS